MQSLLHFFQVHFPSVLEHRYAVLFVASSLEGFNTMVLAGFLVSIGALALVPAALICFAGEFINSCFWYSIGYGIGAKPIDWFVRNDPRKRRLVERIRRYLERYTGRILLLMKVTFSLTIVTLILTGSIKYRFKKFALYNFIGSIGWIIVTFTIGYFFGQGYKLYISYFAHIGYLLIFVVVVVSLLYSAEKISRSILVRTVFVADRLREMKDKLRDGINTFIGEEDDDV